MSTRGTEATSILCDICGVAPCETPNFCEASRIAEWARYHKEKCEPPRPLTRELPPADPFPMDALGSVLASAAHAINDRVQAPLAICGQSVLAAATLAVQGHANVVLPMGHVRPVSDFFVSVAATGERKSAVDQEALRPVHKREADLRETYKNERLQYENDETAWKKAREVAVQKAKGDRARIKHALDELGPPPPLPLEPVLTCSEPTYEGMCKLLAVGWPSIGIFAAEGGQFVGGHGMKDDAKLRTATGFSEVWDGKPIKRVRAGDGATVLPGRRIAMHLMVQPDVATILFADPLLLGQGFLSRVLATAPNMASGTRIFHEASPESGEAMKRYAARLLEILERRLPLAEGTRNELAPRTLQLSPGAQLRWVEFHDYVESRLGAGGELEPVRGLANKLPEHAARIAAVLTLVGDIEAGDVGRVEMEGGISLAEHYAVEALRLFGASRIHADVLLAQRLEAWLLIQWHEPNISLPDIYQRGLNAISDQATARKLVAILEKHGRLVEISGGATIAGQRRREAWRIVREA